MKALLSYIKNWFSSFNIDRYIKEVPGIVKILYVITILFYRSLYNSLDVKESFDYCMLTIMLISIVFFILTFYKIERFNKLFYICFFMVFIGISTFYVYELYVISFYICLCEGLAYLILKKIYKKILHKFKNIILSTLFLSIICLIIIIIFHLCSSKFFFHPNFMHGNCKLYGYFPPAIGYYGDIFHPGFGSNGVVFYFSFCYFMAIMHYIFKPKDLNKSNTCKYYFKLIFYTIVLSIILFICLIIFLIL